MILFVEYQVHITNLRSYHYGDSSLSSGSLTKNALLLESLDTSIIFTTFAGLFAIVPGVLACVFGTTVPGVLGWGDDDFDSFGAVTTRDEVEFPPRFSSILPVILACSSLFPSSERLSGHGGGGSLKL